ncbi:hypothetical protein NECAME_10993 [Necator americanus]|uniref:Uncharacterized protein n=1 Tax=Necator americanus TaxID=51031 RepID=W2T698_NECAM|nr:hypothetical protein NECAME_10993 [Necator americanus]ETN77535.1 hypothetical protein NECAME_10993 [Necator americanus]
MSGTKVGELQSRPRSPNFENAHAVPVSCGAAWWRMSPKIDRNTWKILTQIVVSTSVGDNGCYEKHIFCLQQSLTEINQKDRDFCEGYGI